jgi:predicted regulator of Ras-like GTPase activity (Roadblock/LC7/MglB family)
MAAADMVISEQDHARFTTSLELLRNEANAKLAFLLDKAGQQIAAAGDLAEIDSTSLASLAAGNVAATEGVAQVVGEREFTSLFHEGLRDNLHLTVVGSRAILLVVFDERSSLGLVRLRVGQRAPEIAAIISDIQLRAESSANSPAGGGAFAEITEEDIEALFR